MEIYRILILSLILIRISEDFHPNASGKTNFVKALIYMRNMVLGSMLDKELIKRNEPFKFSLETTEEPTAFEAAFILDEIRIVEKI